MENEEDVIIYRCDQYCFEQGRGHIHRLEKDKIINLEENLMIKNIKKCENIKETETYDCKCEFYWKQFLKFEYSNKNSNIFNLCPAKCPMCNSGGDNFEPKDTFCQEELWHNPLKSENKQDK